MRHLQRIRGVWILAGLAAVVTGARLMAQVELDRIVSRVAGHIITQSDVRQARLLKLVDDVSSDAAVQHALEDRFLILDEMERAAPLPPATDAALAARHAQWAASLGPGADAGGSCRVPGCALPICRSGCATTCASARICSASSACCRPATGSGRPRPGWPVCASAPTCASRVRSSLKVRASMTGIRGLHQDSRPNACGSKLTAHGAQLTAFRPTPCTAQSAGLPGRTTRTRARPARGFRRPSRAAARDAPPRRPALRPAPRRRRPERAIR